MQTQKAYYLSVLYPFQDGIISKMKELDTDFYLTGGTALSRAYYNHRFSFEPKDIADIWVIAKNNSFNWKDILKKAKCKDAAVTEEAATGITRSFPSKYLNKIIWNIEFDTKGFFQELTLISKELSEGIDNSLFEAV